jgi:hypothetical protein
VSGATPDHWLDRLAAAHTRRQILKAALAGAMLTLPFARPARGAIAADPQACQKGCLYTASNRYTNRLEGCAATSDRGFLSASFLVFFVDPLGGLVQSVTSTLGQVACEETALLVGKSASWDCLQPNCPGFDPRGPDGPCAGLNKNLLCCTSSSSATGYTACAVCCHPTGDGCGSGVTECGAGPKP